ncbi:hypothetical protein Dda_4561 [Drechslerella dactyloides]|uniref:Uncharacterized protein n=1 Tax=Drechslerella dactyloides TaxID=74499 RepID=A0AAD6NJH1_DREDA|nr:hypothetical protein Dda_4561 [Drechslerella dactyloides]
MQEKNRARERADYLPSPLHASWATAPPVRPSPRPPRILQLYTHCTADGQEEPASGGRLGLLHRVERTRGGEEAQKPGLSNGKGSLEGHGKGDCLRLSISIPTSGRTWDIH